MKYFFSFICALVFVGVVQSQVSEKFKPYGFKEEDGYRYIDGFELKASVKDLPTQMVYLTSVRGGEVKFVDSTKAIDGKFVFSSPKSPLRGMYRVYLDHEKYFEVILSNELTEVKTTYRQPIEDLKVIYSRENRCYYYYISRMADYEKPLAELYEDPNVNQEYLGRVTDSIIRQKNFYGKQMIRSFPETYAAKLIRCLHIPERADVKPDEARKFPDRVSFMKEHAFDFVNFGDSELLRSDIFHYSIKYYLDNLVQPQTEENYIIACDKIMALAYKDQNVFNYVRTLLMEAFAQIRMDVVYTHLADRYMLNDEACETADTTKRTIKERVELLRKTGVGEPAPELSLEDMQSRKIKLSQVLSKYTLVVFWSTHCSHCKKSLPELKKLYMKYQANGLEVYAVNLDSVKAEWISGVNQIKGGWVDVRAPQGIDDMQVADYAIRATPKYFLLDKNKLIVTKPKNIAEVENDLLNFTTVK